MMAFVWVSSAARIRPGPVCTLAIAAGLAVLLAGNGVAAAERVGLLGYAPPGAPLAAVGAADALESAIREGGNEPVAAVIEAAQRGLRSGAVPVGTLQYFARARTLAGEGWRAYLAVEAEFAAARLAEARRVAVRVAHLPGGLELLADASLRLGAVLGYLGRSDEGTEALRLAVRLDPHREVTLAEFAPEVVSAYEAAAVAAPDPARVRVLSVPPGAEIEIDGRLLGRAPVEVEIPAGQHLLVARAPGRRASARLVASSGGTEEISLEPESRAAAVVAGPSAFAVGRPAESAAAAIEGLMLYAELDAVVLLASVWRGGQPALLGQRCAGIPVRCSAVVEIRYPDPAGISTAGAALWRALTGAEGTLPPILLEDARLTEAEPAPGTANIEPGGCRWCRSGWLWLGVGAAALTAGAVALFARDSEPVLGLSLGDGF